MSASNKTSVQNTRRELISARIENLKEMVFTAEEQKQEIPRQSILDRVVEILTGHPPSPFSLESTSSSGSSTPSVSSETSSDSLGPVKRSRREYKNAHEQARRNKEAAAYAALETFITDNKLQGNSKKLQKLTMLNIAIKALEEQGFARVAVPPRPLPFSIDNILARPPPPLLTPPPTPMDPLQGFPTLAAILQNNFPLVPLNFGAWQIQTDAPQEKEEIIDVETF